MKHYFLVLVSVFFLGVCHSYAFERQVIDLNSDWKFTLTEESDQWQKTKFNDRSWKAIHLPHTWNNFDGQDGGSNFLRTKGYYRKSIEIPRDLDGKKLFLDFGAASKEASVFVNGQFVGKHIGGFARFRFDITPHVRFGKENLVAVMVSNEVSEILPIGGDFTQFGGLYRDLNLLVVNPVHIEVNDYASSGVYITQQSINQKKATLDAVIKLSNLDSNDFNGAIEFSLWDASNKKVWSENKPISIAKNVKQNVSFPVSIKSPILWQGKINPYLYTAKAELKIDSEIIDSVDVPIGLRSFTIDAKKGFNLNDERLLLQGVNRHQDRQAKGWAISQADKDQDMALMLEMGVNAVRLAHYQHDDYFYHLCDAIGLVTWAEVVFVGPPPKTLEAQENIKEQLVELIRQHYNNPSIAVWSIGNETQSNKFDSDEAKLSLALLKELNTIAKREDPSRKTVYASHHAPDDPRNFVTDVLGYNKYSGWYRGVFEDFGKFFDDFHKKNPSVPLGISEYGAGGSLTQHEENPPIRLHHAKGPWHPEEWQTNAHEAYWLQIKDRPWFWGTFIWNMFEFAADQRAEGDTYGRNDKGLMSYDRLTRKDAFYWYKANWTQEPMVHIVSKRNWERSTANVDLKAYSNADEVEFKVNDVSVGKVRSVNHRFMQPNVSLALGPNRIEVVAYTKGEIVAVDFTGIVYRSDGTALPYPGVDDDNTSSPEQPTNTHKEGEVVQ